MKKWRVWGSILIALIIVLAIVFATPIMGPRSSSEVTAVEGADFWLYAGQTTPVGTGSVTHTSTSLDFSIDPDCAIYYMHIRIWDTTPVAGEQTGHGVSPPWHHVDFTSSPKTEPFDFSIPIDPFPPDGWTSPFVIAIHADVVCGFYEGETAWAGGADTPEGCESFGGTPWAYYFYYDIE